MKIICKKTEARPASRYADLTSKGLRQRPQATLRPRPSFQPFRFLDLPAEIRNAVHLAASPFAFLKCHSRGRLASASALPRVSRQIRDVFLTILYLRAHIVAKVSKFNSSHVITFLNTLPDADLHTLGPACWHTINIDGERRTLVIRLSTHNTYIPRMDKYMTRWLNRIDDSTKRGFDIDIQYVADPEERGWHHWWARHSRRQGVRAVWSERKELELSKITAAFERDY